jgi:hypothetical protein
MSKPAIGLVSFSFLNIKQAIFPPHEKGVKKINGFFVQKTMLFF